MTLPSERTRAVLLARAFLLRLSSPYSGGIKGVRGEIRQEARQLLRHYPGWHDFMPDNWFDKQEAKRFGEEDEQRAAVKV